MPFGQNSPCKTINVPTARQLRPDRANVFITNGQSKALYGGIMSATSEMLSEIKEVNLSYLLLAQRLLREDKAMGMFRMGISQELADVLANLTLAQTVKLAASNQILCRFRFDDHALLSSLADKGRSDVVTHAHSAILMAGQPVESVR
ncbi:transcriptional activator FlhD [Burkholderia dolosa AU0158]|nr:transcriptional activator FlhD [Burkholderia dolosa AU0158]